MRITLYYLCETVKDCLANFKIRHCIVLTVNYALLNNYECGFTRFSVKTKFLWATTLNRKLGVQNTARHLLFSRIYKNYS